MVSQAGIQYRLERVNKNVSEKIVQMGNLFNHLSVYSVFINCGLRGITVIQ
jgi:hypothetical protein